tara:strand:+ start:2612 stop:3133 length:522 start_codon:yes stop_codon:yes gene_type:complete
MIMRIAIAGKMASGKTTLAKALIERGFQKLSLGGKVKDIARDLFKMDVKDRPLLQQIGMKMREIRPSVWIDYIIDIGKAGGDMVIDDVRFVNEAKALKEAGWTIIRLNIEDNLQKERLQNTYDNWEVHWNNRGDPSETEVMQILANHVDLELESGPDAVEQMLEFIFASDTES